MPLACAHCRIKAILKDNCVVCPKCGIKLAEVLAIAIKVNR